MLEIERKFLVADEEACLRQAVESHSIEQAYLCREPDATVRLRVIDGREAYLTVKSRNHGATRGEWEYAIPVEEARQMMAECGCQGVISKTRHIVPRLARHPWEIDVFHGDNEGLVLAEVEMASEDEAVDLPSWIGREVTGDPHYYNSILNA